VVLKCANQFVRSSLQTTFRVVGLVLLLSAFSGRALAAVGPEMDPGSAVSAMTLLVGGLFLFAPRGRSRDKIKDGG
jgi:hypothetical protein